MLRNLFPLQAARSLALHVSSRAFASSVCLLTVAMVLQSATAQAGILFDFNSLSSGVNSSSGSDAIEAYMSSIYGSAVTVDLGARTMKSKPEEVGPWPYLGNTDFVDGDLQSHWWYKDTYLINRWNASWIPADQRDRITITFEEEAIGSIAFDWQIFPVTTGKADFTVKADGETVFYYDNALDKYNGYLSHTELTFDAPVHKLEFIDWYTAPIGIDNLYVNPPPPPPPSNQSVPEPATALMMLLGTLGIGAVRRRTHTAA